MCLYCQWHSFHFLSHLGLQFYLTVYVPLLTYGKVHCVLVQL